MIRGGTTNTLQISRLWDFQRNCHCAISNLCARNDYGDKRVFIITNAFWESGGGGGSHHDIRANPTFVVRVVDELNYLFQVPVPRAEE